MKNDDLIRRGDLIAAYDAAHKGPPGGARKLMEEAPTVDAAPVIHGEWKPVKAGTSNYPFWDNKCSACGHITSACINGWMFCPWCGAKMMDGGEN